MADPFELYFQQYAAAFNDFDAEAIAAFFHAPCLMVNGEYANTLSGEPR